VTRISDITSPPSKPASYSGTGALNREGLYRVSRPATLGFLICGESHGWMRLGGCKQGWSPLTQKNLHNLHNLHGVLPGPDPKKRRAPFVGASAGPPNCHFVFTASPALDASTVRAAERKPCSAFVGLGLLPQLCCPYPG